MSIGKEKVKEHSDVEQETPSHSASHFPPHAGVLRIRRYIRVSNYTADVLSPLCSSGIGRKEALTLICAAGGVYDLRNFKQV
jgi:hypothetical protein